MKKGILAALLLLALFTLPAAAAAGKPPTYEKPPRNEGPRGGSGEGTYLLVEKDPDTWEIIEGKEAASGKVTYNLSGSTFNFDLKAKKLEPNRKYRIDFIVTVTVDDKTTSTYYSIASVASDHRGTIRYAAELSQFAEAVCVNGEFDEPTPIQSGRTYEIKIHVKYDGSPPSGESGDLPCSGEGDGNFDYVLFEFLPLTFTGE